MSFPVDFNEIGSSAGLADSRLARRDDNISPDREVRRHGDKALHARKMPLLMIVVNQMRVYSPREIQSMQHSGVQGQ